MKILFQNEIQMYCQMVCYHLIAPCNLLDQPARLSPHYSIIDQLDSDRILAIYDLAQLLWLTNPDLVSSKPQAAFRPSASACTRLVCIVPLNSSGNKPLSENNNDQYTELHVYMMYWIFLYWWVIQWTQFMKGQNIREYSITFKMLPTMHLW